MWRFLLIGVLYASGVSSEAGGAGSANGPYRPTPNSQLPTPFEVQTLGGESLVGPLTELTADRITVDTADGPVSVQTAKVLLASRSAAFTPRRPRGKPEWSGSPPSETSLPGFPDRPQNAPGVWVDLVDGSRLFGAGYTATSGKARIVLAADPFVEIPVRDVKAVQLQAPTESMAAEWARILQLDVPGDLLVVRGEAAIDYHQGGLRDVTEDVVQFELEGEVLPVQRAKVQGLVYSRPAAPRLPDPVCRITETGGSQWPATSLALEGGHLRWTTPLELEVVRAPGDVARIDFSQGKIVYLSDLEPESMAWTPCFGPAGDPATGDWLERTPSPKPPAASPFRTALAEFFAPRKDRALKPGPLRLDGKTYRKGLALHSRTRLVYRLPGPFRRFEAIVGIDDRVRPRGNVRLVIRGDGRVLLETAESGTDPPRRVDLDLSGVRRLEILVDYGDDLDVADHLDLCEARVMK